MNRLVQSLVSRGFALWRGFWLFPENFEVFYREKGGHEKEGEACGTT